MTDPVLNCVLLRVYGGLNQQDSEKQTERLVMSYTAAST